MRSKPARRVIEAIMGSGVTPQVTKCEIETYADRLEIRLRYQKLAYAVIYAVILLVDTVIPWMNGQSFRSTFDHVFLPVAQWLRLIWIPILFLLGMQFCNSKRIRVSRSNITISFGPLNLFPSRTFPLNRIVEITYDVGRMEILAIRIDDGRQVVLAQAGGFLMERPARRGRFAVRSADAIVAWIRENGLAQSAFRYDAANRRPKDWRRDARVFAGLMLAVAALYGCGLLNRVVFGR
jgi:hypothetical protein